LSEVETVVKKGITQYDFDLSEAVVDNPNFLGLRLIGKTMISDLIVLGIISWYVEKISQVYIREFVLEKKFHLSLEDQVLVELVLDSKAIMEIFILETNLWHSRDFFGNILDISVLGRIRKRFNGFQRIKKPERKRGYHDHGSRVEDHRWLPKVTLEFTELQNEIERDRISKEETLSFLRGTLE
jgi:hypothetical protein